MHLHLLNNVSPALTIDNFGDRFSTYAVFCRQHFMHCPSCSGSANLADSNLGDLCSVGAFATRVLIERAVDRMPAILRTASPLQVDIVIMRFIAVSMVYLRKILGIRNEVLCDQAMDINLAKFAGAIEMNRKVSLSLLTQYAKLSRLTHRSATPMIDGARERSDAPVVRHLVRRFIARNWLPDFSHVRSLSC